MPVRLKKFIGTIVIIVLVTLYALLATTIAVGFLGESSGWVHLAYFFFTGFLWIIPAMVVIKWMETPPRRERR
ncbi:DUF2842 domain-containing protein [Fulvimarina endophytica]|uniref:DUF2842 domain-containing protein n=1 Tax=Fulvimarina endophytica TaxID=2293836 RepID=A0A371X0Z5_9HYPH|nr:DUF2842 domain-containing protein [Fulvimarina endophytica]RFC62902.1 DUF2842 domain-containing protein [Fulvimarina endophytica]